MIFLKSHLPSNTLIQLNKARGIDKETFTIEIVTILKRKKKKKKKSNYACTFFILSISPKEVKLKEPHHLIMRFSYIFFFFFTLAAKKSE